jgi:hypothetical protein
MIRLGSMLISLGITLMLFATVSASGGVRIQPYPLCDELLGTCESQFNSMTGKYECVMPGQVCNTAIGCLCFSITTGSGGCNCLNP